MPFANFSYSADGTPVQGQSFYWSGSLTTVKNEMFNIEAGHTLDLLVLSLNAPHGDGIITGGLKDASLWTDVYPVIARALEKGATPVIKSFLASV